MNNLAIVIAALINAANAENAYAVNATTIRSIREAVPANCMGYSFVGVENVDRLKATLNGSLNKDKKHYFGFKIIPSTDPRYADGVVVYFTKSVCTKWVKGEEPVPANLSQFINNNSDEEGLAS